MHRLVALRDLGLSLQQIGKVLPEDPTVDQLRGMLRLRRAELEQQLTEDEARLRRVEAHLRALDRGAVVSNLDVVMKTSEPIRVVEVQGRAAGFGHENLGPVFERLVPWVLGALGKRGTKPGMMVAWYDEPNDDGSVVVHVGFEIGEQDYDPVEPTSVTVLPTVRVASVVHKGPMDDIGLVFEALVGWVEASGERLAGRSRELYLHWDDEHPAGPFSHRTPNAARRLTDSSENGISDRAVLVKGVSPEATPLLLRLGRSGSCVWACAGLQAKFYVKRPTRRTTLTPATTGADSVQDP